jgi:hypothetical protein
MREVPTRIHGERSHCSVIAVQWFVDETGFAYSLFQRERFISRIERKFFWQTFFR